MKQVVPASALLNTAGAFSYSWDFGDGSTPSTEQNPTHEYLDAGTYTVDLTVSDGVGVVGTEQMTISVSGLEAPVITPDGQAFSEPLTVKIGPPDLSEMLVTPGWRTGVKYPELEYETISALSRNDQAVTAIRARTQVQAVYIFPGANMSPDSGQFPFYIWSLADLTGNYRPALFAGATEKVDWGLAGPGLQYTV